MLIEEVQDIAGLSYPQIDEQLHLPDGQAYRYALDAANKKSRAPQAHSVQNLEFRVARLLKRPARRVIIRNNGLCLFGYGDEDDQIIGTPGENFNLRGFESSVYRLGYEEHPTYWELKYSAANNTDGKEHSLARLMRRKAPCREWDLLRLLFSFQWGILWSNGAPWSSGEETDFPGEVSSDTLELALAWLAECIYNDTAVARDEWLRSMSTALPAGILPEWRYHRQLQAVKFRKQMSSEVWRN